MSLIENLKQNKEDFEYYPTTNGIIERMFNDLVNLRQDAKVFKYIRHTKTELSTILDIGAGKGDIFQKLTKLYDNYVEDNISDSESKSDRRSLEMNLETVPTRHYAIEKSTILLQKMPKHIVVIGTDFHEQTLIDKKLDVIFCNPPYSEYADWMYKILKENTAYYTYMVIPDRWEKSEKLQTIIQQQHYSVEILGQFDFIEAERSARAKVHLVRFAKYNYTNQNSAFGIWFRDHFKIDFDKISKQKTNEDIENALISKKNIIQELVNMYNEERNNLLDNYIKISDLDASILKELGISLDSLIAGLELKISNRKSVYWKIAFDRLEPITKRLTKKYRDIIREKLEQDVNIDFTESNIYAILLWTIKHSNTYFDKQLITIYDRFVDVKAMREYKSNQRWQNDEWRYVAPSEDEITRMKNSFRQDKYKTYGKNKTHYWLDYRVIVRSWNYSDYLDILDLIAIATNLGFTIELSDNQLEKCKRGEKITVYTDEGLLFGEFRFYQNSNIHCKFSQEFMQKFNIEAARLKGWIKSPVEASEELNIPLAEVEKMFNTNIRIPLSNTKLLM